MIEIQPYDTICEEVTIDAPAERVFDAFFGAADRMNWWNHHEWVACGTSSDLRPGGKWEVRVRGDGRENTGRGEYIVVDRPRLAIFTWSPDWTEIPLTSLVRVEVQERDGGSLLRLTHSGLVNEAERDGTKGWPALFGVLKSYVERKQ